MSRMEEEATDYYVVLGVATDASTVTIKKAFKHLALKYHPDIYKGPDAKERMQEILRAYQTLTDPEQRRRYDLAHHHGATTTETEEEPQDTYTFVYPPLHDNMPAQLDLGKITYILSAREARRLKEDGMLRGAKIPTAAGTFYCHRCQNLWQAQSKPEFCPQCKARDWYEYLLLRCQHCHAVFESEQIRYEVGSFQYGKDALCPPYELFPLCPACGKAQWCPAEEERLWNVRDRVARREKWRKRFGLTS